VAKIRQKNDAFQKHLGPDIDDELKEEIRSQSKFIDVPNPNSEGDNWVEGPAKSDGDKV